MTDIITTTTEEEFNIIEILLNSIRENSQHKYFLNTFIRHGFNVRISKRQLEKEFGLQYAFKDVTINEANPITSINQLTDLAGYLPGDLQRTLRTFYDKYHDYGIQRDDSGDNIYYWWTPITRNEYNWINGTPIVPRNIFNNDEERDAFVASKQGKCEICSSTTRLAIDHWRAHSVYKIDSPLIAVLLCEQCNNTHHNYDGSKIMIKKKENLQCVRNWFEIEKRICANGYPPNESDKKCQNENIEAVIHYYRNNHNLELTYLLGELYSPQIDSLSSSS
jgi:hypothetical protein